MGEHLVTGAFGFSGKYIAAALLQEGQRVRTLTNSPDRGNPFEGAVPALPFHFEDPQKLRESMAGVDVFYNTYWVRFPQKGFDQSAAVANSRKLFDAARQAGVGRIVHISITNPSEDSPLPYFRGKALVERALAESGVPHTILRPAVLFGREDILFNNIAWLLRRLPVFGLFGRGGYRLQPTYVGDLADLALVQGKESGNRTIDAIGPETFTYRHLVGEIGRAIGRPRPMVALPPFVPLLAGGFIGWVRGDVVVTRDEIRGLMDELLFTRSHPACGTRFSRWAREHGSEMGRKYASEVARRRDRRRSYEEL